MDPKLGAVKRYSDCKKRYVFEIVFSAILGAVLLCVFFWEQRHGPDFSLIAVIPLPFALYFLAFAVHYIVVSLRCSLYVYENGIVFSMPAAPFTVKTKTVLFDEIVSAEYKSRVARFRDESLVIHTLSGDHVLRHIPSAELNSLYDFLRNRASLSGD
jgi:hypothetical protein